MSVHIVHRRLNLLIHNLAKLAVSCKVFSCSKWNAFALPPPMLLFRPAPFTGCVCDTPVPNPPFPASEYAARNTQCLDRKVKGLSDRWRLCIEAASTGFFLLTLSLISYKARWCWLCKRASGPAPPRCLACRQLRTPALWGGWGLSQVNTACLFISVQHGLCDWCDYSKQPSADAFPSRPKFHGIFTTVTWSVSVGVNNLRPPLMCSAGL